MNEYDILLCICQENDITGLERVVRNRKVDGIVLLRTFLKDPQIELLLEKKFRLLQPVVPHTVKLNRWTMTSRAPAAN